MTHFLRKPFSYSYKRITLWLIGINFLIFLPGLISRDFYNYSHFYCSLNAGLVVNYHMYWQFLTYMFMHQNITHILFNMIGLLMFGTALERAIGSKEFLVFYLVCGILSGFFSFIVYYFTKTNTFLLGASGAIYSVLFAYAVFYPKSIIYIWGVIPVPAPVIVIIYAAIEIFSEVFTKGNSNIAHLAHLFGFLAAWLYLVIRMGLHPVKVWKNAYLK